MVIIIIIIESKAWKQMQQEFFVWDNNNPGVIMMMAVKEKKSEMEWDLSFSSDVDDDSWKMLSMITFHAFDSFGPLDDGVILDFASEWIAL